jgi:uncharacterized protein (TIGR02271 family)
MSTVELRIRSGAAVECSDGYLGTVSRLETDHLGNLTLIHVAADAGDVIVPERDVRSVRPDGTVMLACSRDAVGRAVDASALGADGVESDEVIALREERLVAHREMEQIGEIVVRTEVESVPGRLEVEAQREEVQIEHVPVGQIVTERSEPWEEDGVLVVPVYEEQMVVTKRLVLREHLRVRRVRSVERQLFQETLERERVVVEDPNNTGLVREMHPADPPTDSHPTGHNLLGGAPSGKVIDPMLPSPDEIRRATENADPMRPEGSFLGRVVRGSLD